MKVPVKSTPFASPTSSGHPPLSSSLTRWTHLAVVFRRRGCVFPLLSCIDNKNKGIKYPVRFDVFLNGNHQDTAKSTRYIQNSIPFHVGSFYDNQLPFIGCIASVLLYSEALSGTAIADLARYRPVPTESERLFIKLRPEVLSERVGETSRLLGINTVGQQMNSQIDRRERSPRRGADRRVCGCSASRGGGRGGGGRRRTGSGEGGGGQWERKSV